MIKWICCVIVLLAAIEAGTRLIKSTLPPPPGVVVSYLGDNALEGWMIADGRCLSAGDYPELSKALRAPDGTWVFGNCNPTSFRLPNLDELDALGNLVSRMIIRVR